ncbi:conserved hypothetical protein [Ricinus communis]|uniref:Uncharacterized protein n=1 Tax=Ricinus communis TaxID=3988 RepID=B9TI89_RICCO|nr:conserved hypothetical protein [Ricinus communis]
MWPSSSPRSNGSTRSRKSAAAPAATRPAAGTSPPTALSDTPRAREGQYGELRGAHFGQATRPGFFSKACDERLYSRPAGPSARHARPPDDAGAVQGQRGARPGRSAQHPLRAAG